MGVRVERVSCLTWICFMQDKMLVGKPDGEESTQVSGGELIFFIVIFDKLG